MSNDPAGFQKLKIAMVIDSYDDWMKKMQTPLAVPSQGILKKAIREMDIVHIQFPFFLGMDSVRISRKYKVPVVSTFHIQAEHLAMNAGIRSDQFIRYCYRIWMKTIYNRSTMVICPSGFAESVKVPSGKNWRHRDHFFPTNRNS